MKHIVFIKDRFTKCDSGATLNKLMHPFLLMTFFISIGFLFFDHTHSIQAFTLYQESAKWDGLISAWGVIGLGVTTFHTAGFLIRGKVGTWLWAIAIFGGFYLWLYAAVIYIIAGLYFQFLVLCFPNLYFWAWYAFERGKRKRGEDIAFV